MLPGSGLLADPRPRHQRRMSQPVNIKAGRWGAARPCSPCAGRCARPRRRITAVLHRGRRTRHLTCSSLTES
ncbi:hypothetical protein SKAU_G00047010 [Synaphobranchus kaupii]|uniref:Uncharacterized protein n=1 Tax=Synaphobranchus kaupii TaxID=118154 RepID=A0A9Q1G331_SYNKA|nr:hypothetical protein SKAU_G00047010 [Synaphobranchus kaupii]